MEFFQFCLEIIKRESERFNVGVNASTASQLTAATANDVSYDNAHNRCAFIYRCGTINLSFAKDCFSKFLLESNGMNYLLTKWKFDSHLTFCSISKGPAFDYIALLLSHEQARIFTSLVGNIKVISKHGAWRNSANIMLEMINKGYFNSLPPSVGNIEVIQGDPFNNFTQKVKLPISDSDVVMMTKTLNLQSDGYDQEKISKTIKDFLDSMKPGAVLFCIDTKPSVKEITQLLSTVPGKFLFEPTYLSSQITLECADLYKACFGCSPVLSGRGCFFVWEKSLISIPNIKCEFNEISEAIKHAIGITDEKCSEVAADKSSVELISKPIFSEESSKCEQPSTNYFSRCSTPSKRNRLASKFDCENKDLQFADNLNNSFEKSDSSLFTGSLIHTSSPLSDHCQKESLNTSLSSLRSQLDVISNNICMEAESDEVLKRNELDKITELTNKITDLTVELTKVLENDAVKHYVNDSCSRNSEVCNSPEPKFDSCKNCSCSSQNIKTHSYCEKCECSQSHSFSRCNKSNACISPKVSDSCRPQNIARSTFLHENTSSTPQLIIPLNSVSESALSQIISLLTQSKQDK